MGIWTLRMLPEVALSWWSSVGLTDGLNKNYWFRDYLPDGAICIFLCYPMKLLWCNVEPYVEFVSTAVFQYWLAVSPVFHQSSILPLIIFSSMHLSSPNPSMTSSTCSSHCSQNSSVRCLVLSDIIRLLVMISELCSRNIWHCPSANDIIGQI